MVNVGCSDKYKLEQPLHGEWVSEPGFTPNIRLSIPDLSEQETKQLIRENRSNKYYIMRKVPLKMDNKTFEVGYCFMTNFQDGVAIALGWREDGKSPILEYDYGIEGIFSVSANNGENMIVGYYYSYETTDDEEVINSTEKQVKLIQIK